MATYQQRMLTETAEKIAVRLAQRYGSLKAVLSAGIISLDKLSPAERERMLDESNGIIPTDPSQQAAESARFTIKKFQALDPKQFAVALQFLPSDESKALQEMLAFLNPAGKITKYGKNKTA